MFDQMPSYPAAYVGEFPCHDARPALQWAIEQAREAGCKVIVVAPERPAFRDNRLNFVPSSVGQETFKTFRSCGPGDAVVVACWPSEKVLDRIDRSYGLKGMIVVPWLEAETEAWRQARQAVDLLGLHETPPLPAMDPVVVAALDSLTLPVNLSTGLSHPSDRSSAIWTFKILRGAGYSFEPHVIKGWAMSHGWHSDGAQELSDYAAGVLRGHRYRTGGERFRPGVLDHWRERAAEAAGE